MTTNLTEWEQEIAGMVPGCPAFLITRQVRECVKDFCRETLLWDYTLDEISVVDGTKNYTLSIPSVQQGQIIEIKNIKYKDDGEDDDQYSSLSPIVETDMDMTDSGSWEFADGGTPSKFYFDMKTDTVYLYPIPGEDSASGLRVKVYLMPTEDATYVQDFIYDKYKQLVTDGAVASLLRIHGQPWSDPGMSQFYNSEYERKRDNLKMKKWTGFTNKLLRIIPRGV